ncbi:MAG: DUF1993 domain-containing protein [Pseudomonadota bacterium]|nr:DUF1993 domain-containing protein [Pseudomonadota bacterium]
MSLHTQYIATYRSRFDTLNGLLSKAEAHEKGDDLLKARLAEDMHPLSTQVRFVTNIPGEALARLGIREFASSDAEIASLAEAKAMVAERSAMLDAITATDLPEPETPVEFSIGDGAFNFALTADEYFREFSLPNFYFHLSIAYAILRKEGLEIGKADFIPHMARYFKAPAAV